MSRAGRDGMHVCLERLAEIRLIAAAHEKGKAIALEALLPGELAWLADRAMDALDLEERLKNSRAEASVLRDAYLGRFNVPGGGA